MTSPDVPVCTPHPKGLCRECFTTGHAHDHDPTAPCPAQPVTVAPEADAVDPLRATMCEFCAAGDHETCRLDDPDDAGHGQRCCCRQAPDPPQAGEGVRHPEQGVFDQLLAAYERGDVQLGLLAEIYGCTEDDMAAELERGGYRGPARREWLTDLVQEASASANGLLDRTSMRRAVAAVPPAVLSRAGILWPLTEDSITPDPLRADAASQARIVKAVLQAHRRVSDELADAIGVEVVSALADWDAWLDSGGYERARQRRRKAMH